MKMTRFLSLTLALLLTLALFTTAMAANEDGSTATIPLIANYETEATGVDKGETWYLDYETSAIDFGTIMLQKDYGDPDMNSAQWNPETGRYTFKDSAFIPVTVPEIEPKALSVTNKSNFDVTVTASADGQFSASVTNNTTIAYDESATVTVNLDLYPSGNSGAVEGTLTITFAKSGNLYPVLLY